MPRKPAIAEPDDIRLEFHEHYGTGSDFEGAVLIDVLVAAGRLVAEIVGEEVADRAFATLVRDLGYEVEAEPDWADVLESEAFGDAMNWPMGERFHNLNAFAYRGVALNRGETEAERERLLRAEIAAVEAFMAKVAFAAWRVDPGDAGRTAARARARFDLDTGAPIAPSTLAALAGVTERRIRNMMAGAERRFKADSRGKIPAKDAIDWLNGRPAKFAPSVWRGQNAFNDLAQRDQIEEAIFVPVASDGSVFHPGLARDDAYRIGPSSHEERHESYEDALAALQKMHQPVWQRPTPRGHWTKVTAVRWARYERFALNALSTATLATRPEGD